ncbi:mitochondrial carrier domain-containing protein [Elsinoe ampelina]|uniref:Mitochondrial thiamine pyrophosphate carrier 1 n=1 Tax=Elsinoe ampelina TaxID=302913 RepID=A0A6A6GMJ9_9PEZI|nr:mitochondrial carrier domain-containing protein [Elsinoe ampelina]
MTSIAAKEGRPGAATTEVGANFSLDVNKGKRPIDRQSWEYVIKSGLAGGFAGCAAKTVVGPLDRVKILFQASNPQFQKYTGSWFGVIRAVRDIYTADGTRGLFRGHSATLLRIFPYAGIKFLAYEQVRAVVIRDHTQETSVRRFASGSIAGMVSVFFTYPLEVIRVRMAWETKAHARTSYLDICRRIYHEQPPSRAQSGNSGPLSATSAAVQRVAPGAGIGNFFRGFTPTMWGMLPYAGSSFLAHDSAGDLMRDPRIAKYTTLPETAGKSKDPNKPAQLKYWAELSTGAFAGFVSQTASYPLEVIRRRMQVGGVVGDGHRLGMAEVARQIMQQKGWRGFYVGLGIGYAKVVPMVSVSFYAYERAKFWLGI